MDHICNCWLHALCFVFRCQLLWHPPGAQFSVKQDVWKRITVHHMACQITRPNTTWFFSVGVCDGIVLQDTSTWFGRLTRKNLYCCQQTHSKDIGLEVNSEKTKYMITSKGHQYVIWQTYKKEFMLLPTVSTMSHHRYFITHGLRLNLVGYFQQSC